MNNRSQTSTRRSCRLCGTSALYQVLMLPISPLADHYGAKPYETCQKFPQDLYICKNCCHLQLIDVVDPNTLYNINYTYKPSNNNTLNKHFNQYAVQLLAHIKHPVQAAIDIGSNDGAMLCSLKALGVPICVGVEPVKYMLENYEQRGLKGHFGFWSNDLAEQLKKQYGLFNIVTANNVFAHDDNLVEFVRSIRTVISDDGIFATEISYLKDIIEKRLVGTFFHEHLSHHSLVSLLPFLERLGFYCFDATEADTQGGALILYASPTKRPISENLSRLVRLEEKLYSTHSDVRDSLVKGMDQLRRDLISLLKPTNLKDIVLYGASRSSNLIVDFLGIRGRIRTIIDSNEAKIGRYLFESSAKIIKEEDHQPEPGDIVLISAWTQSTRITQRIKELNLFAGSRIVSLYPYVSNFLR